MLRRYEVAHRSMTPELEPGDYLIARRTRHLGRGDVVIFEHPQRPGLELVKRVVGLSGERVEVLDGRVHIDGRALDEPWAHGASGPPGEWHLASGVFVLGDQRVLSTDDSRTIGPVPSSGGMWKVVFCYWPLRRAGPVPRRGTRPPMQRTSYGGRALDMALQTEVAAPIDVVWEIITDLERSPQVIGAIEDIERLDDGMGFDVGTRWRETRTMFGRQATEELVITAVEPGRSYTVEADGHGAHYVSTMMLEETGPQSTRLSMTFEAQPDNLVNRVLANTVGRLMMGSTRKALERDLADIARAASTS